MKKQKEKYRTFNVNGAGIINISNSCEWKCGGEYGFSFDVSWGKYGYAGGVLPISEAKNLAEFILKTIEKNEVLRHKERHVSYSQPQGL